MNIKEYLGKEINVKIDRPLGNKHPKHGFIYPVKWLCSKHYKWRW